MSWATAYVGNRIGVTHPTSHRQAAIEQTSGRTVVASANGHRRFWVENVLSLAKERDSYQQGTGAIRSDYERLPIGPEYRSVARSDRASPSCLYVSLPSGNGRDREGT